MFLAHLFGSQGELIGWDSSRRPCVRPSTLSNMNISETGWPIAIKFYMKHHGGGGGGGDCIRFWCRSDQEFGFHGNR